MSQISCQNLKKIPMDNKDHRLKKRGNSRAKKTNRRKDINSQQKSETKTWNSSIGPSKAEWPQILLMSSGTAQDHQNDT